MSQPTHKYFAIFGTMRSGSNLLEQSLNQFSNITCHGELFNPSFMGHFKARSFKGLSMEDRESEPFSLIEAMIKEDDSGISGFRIFQNHDERVADIALQDPKCAKIILQRDPLQSYISLMIAKETEQWIVTKAANRRTVKIIFDSAKYQKYLDKHSAYYASIRRVLQETGQTAFWVHYPEQKDMAVLNGIAKFLGATETLKAVQKTILRQNPGSLQDKVENYDEMKKFFSQWNEPDAGKSEGVNPVRGANIPKMVTCIHHPLLFCPIPGGPNEAVQIWMRAVDGNNQTLRTGHNQKTLFEWMQANPNGVNFTAVRHPIPRAYDAFMEKIFPAGPNSYVAIRAQLVKHFDLTLPESETQDRNDLMAAGYGISQHRAAFHAFLRFLKHNLASDTSIRVDGLWASQMTFLPSFNAAVPVTVLAKEAQLQDSFRYIETLLNLPKPKPEATKLPDHTFDLNEIYTRQTENLARKAYSADYTRFGFDDYQAALDV